MKRQPVIRPYPRSLIDPPPPPSPWPLRIALFALVAGTVTVIALNIGAR